MTTVLVTGGTGMLGSVLVPALCNAEHDVRVLSRSPDSGSDERASVVQGDLRDPDSVAPALEGVSTVVHAATSPRRRTRPVDVEGTRHLLERCAAAAVGHFLFPSIVGVDRHPLRYYRAKWEAEQAVEAGPVPWTIARATQFHDLLDAIFGMLARSPVVPYGRGFVFQPVATAEYVDTLVDLVGEGPSGRAPDTGGPEVRPLKDLLGTWLEGRGKRRLTLPVPIRGRTGRAFRQGVHTCPDRAVGAVTWEQHLAGAGTPPSTAG